MQIILLMCKLTIRKEFPKTLFEIVIYLWQEDTATARRASWFCWDRTQLMFLRYKSHNPCSAKVFGQLLKRCLIRLP